MMVVKEKRVQSSNPRANPYSGGVTYPEIERIIEEGKQRRQEVQSGPAGEQDDDDGGDDGGGEDDDIRSGRDYDASAGYVRGNLPSPLLLSVNSGDFRPVPLGSALPPFSGGAAVAAAPDNDDDTSSPSGIFDGLAKLHPDTIINKTRLAIILMVSEKTILRRVERGDLPPPHMRIGRQPQWIVGPLLDWLKDKARGIAGQEDARRQHIRDRTECHHIRNETE